MHCFPPITLVFFFFCLVSLLPLFCSFACFLLLQLRLSASSESRLWGMYRVCPARAMLHRLLQTRILIVGCHQLPALILCEPSGQSVAQNYMSTIILKNLTENPFYWTAKKNIFLLLSFLVIVQVFTVLNWTKSSAGIRVIDLESLDEHLPSDDLVPLHRCLSCEPEQTGTGYSWHSLYSIVCRLKCMHVWTVSWCQVAQNHVNWGHHLNTHILVGTVRNRTRTVWKWI